jgi:hypothetical protein
MNTITILVYIIVIIALLKLLFQLSFGVCRRGMESLTSRPNNKDKDEMVNQILHNQRLFNKNSEIYKLRHIMPWIDAIILEDLRILIRENKFNKLNILHVLS